MEIRFIFEQRLPQNLRHNEQLDDEREVKELTDLFSPVMFD